MNLNAADVAVAETFQSGAPRLLHQFPVALTHGSESGGHYGITPDGRQFVIGLNLEESPVRSLDVVVNWLELLKK